MTNVDQFESVFRSAAKEIFVYERPRIRSVLVVTDLDGYEAELFGEGAQQFLRVLDDATWTVTPGSAYRTVRELLDVVEQTRADLICTYRHLQSEGWRWPFTLGDHLEVLTQATTTPVVVLPHPRVSPVDDGSYRDTKRVMAITDHLTGDDRLVNFAARLTETDGTLLLTHVEDEIVFERLIEVIGKLPDIDTDVARVAIGHQLLKEPREYIETCRLGLDTHAVRLIVEPLVRFGHQLRTYASLVAEHDVDLLVFNTKDESQLAMHGLAYPLAIELRTTPLLML